MDKAITEIVNLPVSGTQLVKVNAKRAACNHRVMDARGRLQSSKEVQELNEAKDCRLFSVLKTLTGN